MEAEQKNNKVTDKVGQGAAFAGKGFLFTLKAFWVSARSVFALIFIVLIYTMPLGIAMLRGRKNTVAIGALNIFLGWSIIGWVIALIWALKSQEQTIVVVQDNSK